MTEFDLYVEKPVTFRAQQYFGQESYELIEELLKGSNVKLEFWHEGVGLRYPPPPYDEDGYVMYGKSKALWLGDYVIVSSLGEVTVLSDEDFKEKYAYIGRGKQK